MIKSGDVFVSKFNNQYISVIREVLSIDRIVVVYFPQSGINGMQCDISAFVKLYKPAPKLVAVFYTRDK